MLFYGEIKGRAERLQKRLVEIRRHFHRHPELSFKEKETGEYIYSLLQDLGLEVKKNVGGTGVVALLKGKKPGRTVAIRADMDALPVQDKKETPYASINKGICHACGHDAHMAIVIGVVFLLSEINREFAGQVKFIFQPAEEKPPGGASLMIKEGVLEDPPVDCLLGAHMSPYHPAGTVALKKGEVMAAADIFELTVLGKGGHGAAPHQGVDAIAVASQVIQSLQLISSRMTEPTEPVVLTIGTIKGGEGFNIIAGEVKMQGTVRTFSPSLRDKMKDIMEKIVNGVTSSFDAGYKLDYFHSYPALVNDNKIMDIVEGASREVLGDEGVVWLEKPFMGSEDFSCYLEHVPGAYVFLGARQEESKEVYPWHHYNFDINEDALSIGAGLLSWTILRILNDYF